MKKEFFSSKEELKKRTEELHDHIRKGRVNELKKYLYFRGNPNVAFGKHNSLTFNETLLGIACENGQKDCVKILLECNANPNMRTYNSPGYSKDEQTKELNHGATPLMVCINSKCVDKEEIAKLLIHYGALVNDGLLINAEEFKKKPFAEKVPTNSLHCAVLNKDIEALRLMLKFGADVNQKDVFNQTAAHKAALNNDKETILLLKANGADLGIRDIKGKTPRDIFDSLSKKIIYSEKTKTKSGVLKIKDPKKDYAIVKF
jgi:ankyrin repeat protein